MDEKPEDSLLTLAAGRLADAATASLWAVETLTASLSPPQTSETWDGSQQNLRKLSNAYDSAILDKAK